MTIGILIVVFAALFIAHLEIKCRQRENESQEHEGSDREHD